MNHSRTRTFIASKTFFNPRQTVRYGYALLLTGVAFVLTYSLKPLAHHYVFDLFQGAVALTAFYEGIGPALVSAALSITLLDFFFIPPLHTLQLGPPDLFRLTIFGAVAVLISSLSARLKRAKTDLEIAQTHLEHRIAERTRELSEANANLTTEITSRLEAEKAMLEISSREQRRLGQDLHDGVCQIVAGAKLISEKIKKTLEARNEPEAKGMQIVESRLSEALSQADMLSRGLYPVELDTNGLMAALSELALKMSHVYSVKCEFKCPHPVFIQDSTVANHLYRIAQEAVTNAIKRGKAERIMIRLRARRTWVALRVVDNGVGFQTLLHRQGMGLRMMHYRARMINAKLQFQSRPGRGTLVRCSFSQDDPGQAKDSYAIG